MMFFANVNYLSIFVAAVAAWLFGAVYYTSLAKPWVAAQGMTIDQHKASFAGKSKAALAAPYVISFIAEFIMAWVLFGVLVHFKTFSLRIGLISAAFIWLGFVLTTVTVNNGFSMRKPMLTVIDSLHWLGVLLIIGAIIGTWGM